MLNNTGYLNEMFGIIDWQYKPFYILWFTHTDLNYFLTIQRQKKNWVKKEPSQVGNHWHNTIVLLDIEELTYVWKQCCSETVCTDKFLAGLSCTLLIAGKSHTKSSRRYYVNNQLTIQNYYIPYHCYIASNKKKSN